MRKSHARSVSEDRLLALRQKGIASDVLEARLEYAEAAVLLSHHVRPLLTVDRVAPRMLPTQASGRWSTTKPPLVNFTAGKKYGPKGIRDVVGPDPGHTWVEWDLDQIEAKITAALSGEDRDLEAFTKGWDVHTLLWCELAGWPQPLVLTTALFTDPSCAAWRDEHDWRNKDDRRRRLAKNCRYAMSYGLNEKAMDKYAVELGMSKEELRAYGKTFLRLRPKLTECKRRWWEHCARTGVARTFLGRRRLLLGDWKTRAKEGWNHLHQGAVADMTNSHIISVSRAFPEATLVLNKHDGVIFDFPSTDSYIDRLKPLVETTWQIEGRGIVSTAGWQETHGGTDG